MSESSKIKVGISVGDPNGIGFEIIDQSSFSSPTIGKDLNETLSEQGKRSITVPLGQIKIKKKIK